MRRRYTQTADAMALEAWFRGVVLKQPVIHLAVRSDNAFVIGVINVVPWIPGEMELALILVCADEGAMWELIELLRFSMEWAKLRRCTDWQISSITQFDFEPIAKRLGPVTVIPHYKLRLA